MTSGGAIGSAALRDAITKPPFTPGACSNTDGEGAFLELENPSILCRRCRRAVTSPDAAIAVNGRHLHHFRNPAGFAFWVRCFSRATGLTIVGVPEKEHTWFPGYSWSVIVCASCSSHLGWFYLTHDNSFFGLIRDNIIEDFTTH